MTDRHVIVGAGPVGRHVAALLAERGSEVVVVTRSGRETGIPGVTGVRADAGDAEALSRVADGASVLYNCANPGDYTQWETSWPPLAAALLEASRRSGAVYAITGNLYPYGPVDGPMAEELPDAATDHKGRLRARMWAEARAEHEAGRMRAVEVRGSDYVGPGVGQNGHITRQLPTARAGKRARVFGDPDLPHSFTDVLDVARVLVAAAEDPSAHGRVWHVPTNAPRSQRQTLTDVLAAGGLPAVPVSSIPVPLTKLGSVFSPMLRELGELSYQWSRPYVLDDSASRAHFGLEPTPWDEVCRRTIAEYRVPQPV
ncbi:NAD-dependent epimerase/dehydratase family protein [Herbiconiux sp. KACC 21604]|uniref:NAD-dependent epimerase/dehydratase family protein n=1 Tax=unclassified Herbiconiux TaxID=2618217 RepID=UPI0014918CD3|nr:NAD-dependent epimerase/dehydratase family protein [Herbiconiux sp. SALV-R1]QJU53358.1 NAD-dependent epimerase/dehydratase family protein [Herbiconiux sp. SALV-R1]WPO88320.1 NAD-dependent epimerase/dehydratase family protein [Herbiconiux sp. KACC 21604]